MNGLYEAALEIQNYCETQSWPFAFIGGLTLVRWGNARQTKDVVLVVLAGFGSETEFTKALTEAFKPRPEHSPEIADKGRVLLLQASNEVPMDISLGCMPFEERMMARSSRFEFMENVFLRTVSAEDLVVLKAFASRMQDWVDVSNILIRQSSTLNMQLVRQELTPLCELKESPETLDQLERLWQSCQDA